MQIPKIALTPFEREVSKQEVPKREASKQEALNREVPKQKVSMQVRLIILEYVLEHLKPFEIFNYSIDLICFRQIIFLRKVGDI